jgi:hypothetical protein
MNRLVMWVIVVAVVLVALGGAFSVYTSQSNGTLDTVTLHVGEAPNGDFTMYLRCSNATGGASCDNSNQTTVTVHVRDRVTFVVVDDQGAGHLHDFNIQGFPAFLYPNSPEMELEEASQSTTITTWLAGTYHILCELPNHDASGMHGTLIVE